MPVDKSDPLVMVILHGGQVRATRHNQTGLTVPAFAERLSDADVADVATCIRNA